MIRIIKSCLGCSFALRNNGEVYAVLTDGGSSGKTEVHIFDALSG